MFEAILDWFHSVGGHRFWLVLVVAIVLLIWLAVEMRDRRAERLADERDEEWAADQVARNKLPTALSIPDVVHVKQDAPVAAKRQARAPKRPNRKRARHK